MNITLKLCDTTDPVCNTTAPQRCFPLAQLQYTVVDGGDYTNSTDTELGFCDCWYGKTSESGCKDYTTVTNVALVTLLILVCFHLGSFVKLVVYIKRNRKEWLQGVSLVTMLLCTGIDFLGLLLPLGWAYEIVATEVLDQGWYLLLDPLYYLVLTAILAAFVMQIISFLLPLQFISNRQKKFFKGLRYLLIGLLVFYPITIVSSEFMQLMWFIAPPILAFSLAVSGGTAIAQLSSVNKAGDASSAGPSTSSSNLIMNFVHDLKRAVRYFALVVACLFVATFQLSSNTQERSDSKHMIFSISVFFARLLLWCSKSIISDFTMRKVERKKAVAMTKTRYKPGGAKASPSTVTPSSALTDSSVIASSSAEDSEDDEDEKIRN